MAVITSAKHGWDKFENQSKTVEKRPYQFKSPEFNSVIDHIKGVVKAGNIDPAEEIKLFKKVVEDRGYSFFNTSTSLQDWKEKFGAVTHLDILNQALEDTEKFIDSVRDPNSPKHDSNRLLFTSQFNSNPENVKAFFNKKRSEEAGETFRPFQNLAHESSILKCGAIRTKHQEFERQIMIDLFRSKWAAVGYVNDQEYKQVFMNSYCVALEAANIGRHF